MKVADTAPLSENVSWENTSHRELVERNHTVPSPQHPIKLKIEKLPPPI